MKEGHKYWVVLLATIFLGIIFLVAGMGKLLAQSDSFSPFLFLGFLPVALTHAIYIVIPYTEISLGALLVLGIAIRFITSLSALMITGFIASNLYMIYLGVGTGPCGGCFGYFGSLTAISSLMLDGIMAALVVVILLCCRGGYFNLMPLFLQSVRMPKNTPSLGVSQGLSDMQIYKEVKKGCDS